jgi:hypothetical protein
MSGHHVLVLRLRTLTDPMDAGSKVEIKFDVESANALAGELYLRVKTSDAAGFQVGDTYMAKLVRMP